MRNRGRSHQNVIILLASAEDREAARFARRYARRGVRLMTPGDLGRSGWVVRLHHSGGSVVASGRHLPMHTIRAVVTRLGFVSYADLVPLIDLRDRDYAAAEMTAFLAAWLQGLGRRVLNAPSPTFLAGQAASLGRFADSSWSVSAAPRYNRACVKYTVSCIDGQPFGGSAAARAPAMEVASATADRLVRLHFVHEGHLLTLAGRDPFVDIGSPPVMRAVMRACR
jgi:hypothetical protein